MLLPIKIIAQIKLTARKLKLKIQVLTYFYEKEDRHEYQPKMATEYNLIKKYELLIINYYGILILYNK